MKYIGQAPALGYPGHDQQSWATTVHALFEDKFDNKQIDKDYSRHDPTAKDAHSSSLIYTPPNNMKLRQ